MSDSKDESLSAKLADSPRNCSFCKKPEALVKKLITCLGPDLHICNECVNLCNQILLDESVGADKDSTNKS